MKAADDSAPPTRHKEGLSLGIAILTAALLVWGGQTTSLTITIILNIVAVTSIILSASSVVRHADVLTHRFGEPYGSLILSLSIVILEVGIISTLMLSGAAQETLMRDAIFSIIIIVMTGLVGLALIIGGSKFKSQRFNLSGVRHYLISIIPLAVIVLVLPNVLPGGEYTSGQLVVVALICLVTYAVFLRIQTKTHQEFFVHAHEDGDEAHGGPSSHGNLWHFVFMAIHLMAVIGVTKLTSGPLGHMLTALAAPPSVAGFLVAILTLSPEGSGALRSILNNQVQRAMNLFLGSVLASISLTVPIVVVIAAITDQRLVMGLDAPDAVLMLCAFLVCQTSLTGGETNAHSGFAHAALFAVYFMLLFS